VTWTVQEGATGGSVTAGGLSTAPATASVFHVVATSAADPSVSGRATITVAAPSCGGPTIRFAVIGDFGFAGAGAGEAAVASLVKGWNPDFVVTVRDNNYEFGEASTIDANIGQLYASSISPYHGTRGPGAAVNAFFPARGEGAARVGRPLLIRPGALGRAPGCGPTCRSGPSPRRPSRRSRRRRATCRRRPRPSPAAPCRWSRRWAP